MKRESTSTSNIFTKKIFSELLKRGTNREYDYVVRRYIESPEEKTNGEIISEIYAYMRTSYRNEYFYLNTLLNKLLAGIHNVNTTTALSQVRVANHVADFVMINGEGHVYEIKSELDNLERLNEQLVDYFKVFSFVSVLSSEHNRNHVEHQLKELGSIGESVGIYVLSDKDTIFNRKISRAPKKFDANLDYFYIFVMLRKKEYENILIDCFGTLPKVPPAFYFRTCFDMFRNIPILHAQKMAMRELKKRNTISKEVFNRVPLELKSVIYFHGLSKQTNMLNDFLEQKFGG